MKRSVLFLLIMTITLLTLAGCSAPSREPGTAGASTPPATTTPEQSTDALGYFPPPLAFNSIEEFVQAVKDPDGYFERTKISYPKEALTNVDCFYLPTNFNEYKVHSITATPVQVTVSVIPANESKPSQENILSVLFCPQDDGRAFILNTAKEQGLEVDSDGALYLPDSYCMLFPIEGGHICIMVPDHLNTYEQIKSLCSVTKYPILRDEAPSVTE